MPGKKNIDTKGARTKAIILKAARKIFSLYPYDVATVRMIGKEADVGYPLINHYFCSKKKLFESVLASICDEYAQKIAEWLVAVKHMPLDQGFMKYVDFRLNYTLKNPEPYQILALNLTKSKDITRIPGYYYLKKCLETNRRIFEEKIRLKGSPIKIERYYNTFALLLTAFIGAGSFIARMQGIKPNSPQYRDLVKETLAYIFIPRLKEVLRVTRPREDNKAELFQARSS